MRSEKTYINNNNNNNTTVRCSVRRICIHRVRCEDVSNDTWETCEEKTKSSNCTIAEAAFKDAEVMIRHVLVQSKSSVPDVDSKESETTKESETSEEDEIAEDEESDEEESDASDNSEEEDEEDDEYDEDTNQLDENDNDHELQTFFFEIEGRESVPALAHKAAKRSADRLSSTLGGDSTLGPSTPQRRRQSTGSNPSSIKQAARRSAQRNAARSISPSRTSSISQNLFF